MIKSNNASDGRSGSIHWLGLLFGPGLSDKFRAEDTAIYASTEAEDQAVIEDGLKRIYPQVHVTHGFWMNGRTVKKGVVLVHAKSP